MGWQDGFENGLRISRASLRVNERVERSGWVKVCQSGFSGFEMGLMGHKGFQWVEIGLDGSEMGWKWVGWVKVG